MAEILVERYGAHPRVRWVRQAHAGVAAASRRAVAMTRAPYVLQLDADDQLLPEAAERLVEVLERDPRLALVYGGAEHYVDGRLARVLEPIPYDPIAHLAGQIVSPPRMFRRRDYQRTSGFDIGLKNAVDFDFTLRLAERGGVRAVPHILYRYHWHGTNTSLIDRAAQRQNHVRAVRAALARRGLDWGIAVNPAPDQPLVNFDLRGQLKRLAQQHLWPGRRV